MSHYDEHLNKFPSLITTYYISSSCTMISQTFYRHTNDKKKMSTKHPTSYTFEWHSFSTLRHLANPIYCSFYIITVSSTIRERQSRYSCPVRQVSTKLCWFMYRSSCTTRRSLINWTTITRTIGKRSKSRNFRILWSRWTLYIVIRLGIA